jgi:hypothetical protein
MMDGPARQRALERAALAATRPPPKPARLPQGGPGFRASPSEPIPRARLEAGAILACATIPALALAPACAALGGSMGQLILAWTLSTCVLLACASGMALAKARQRSRAARALHRLAAARLADPQPAGGDHLDASMAEFSRFWTSRAAWDGFSLWAGEAVAEGEAAAWTASRPHAAMAMARACAALRSLGQPASGILGPLGDGRRRF